MDIKKYLPVTIRAALNAGERIMEIYNNEKFEVEEKADLSPLTKADIESSAIICQVLSETNFPVITEELPIPAYEERNNREFLWMVDPLDGTKEFIKRNGEFTVNIALINKNIPVLGVIYIPDVQLIYFGARGYGSWKYKLTGNQLPSAETIINHAEKISATHNDKEIRFAVSRSHLDDDTKLFIKQLEKQTDKKITVVQTGSSIKFCLIAEGNADIYLRFSPTMEWDTAAGQIIAQCAGAIMKGSGNKSFNYNKPSLKNEGFIVFNEASLSFAAFY